MLSGDAAFFLSLFSLLLLSSFQSAFIITFCSVRLVFFVHFALCSKIFECYVCSRRILFCQMHSERFVKNTHRQTTTKTRTAAIPKKFFSFRIFGTTTKKKIMSDTKEEVSEQHFTSQFGNTLRFLLLRLLDANLRCIFLRTHLTQQTKLGGHNEKHATQQRANNCRYKRSPGWIHCAHDENILSKPYYVPIIRERERKNKVKIKHQ